MLLLLKTDEFKIWTSLVQNELTVAALLYDLTSM